ncbi:TetR family transcriptional regulator [Solihabitans fulvus]|uniref:TetR family transcriptional regulator n=1 Tax=Solihabitans fulvus TaxID=1892852 RepID=A0A5B2XWJ9_9PSEU|nr:TetR/AcrR family transcriptional regulator C-terminal domain-containing protein [Solihabitans fulvus]KAA2267064.1 TetR family transcriptional regulator [Solihabitans fulvus]
MPLRQVDVLHGAIELLDEVGLDELTTRRLAERLGVRVGALYWHYPSKSALLDAITELIIAEVVAEPPPSGDWAEQLRELAARARRSMLAHRDGARLVSSFSTPPPSAMAYMASLIEVLRAAGASKRDAALAADTITSFTNGYTLEEQARKVGTVSRRQLDAAFHAELRIILAGIRAELLG